MQAVKRGISRIIGSTEVKLGEKVFYKVAGVYNEEDRQKLENTLWKLYVKENGKWRELKPNPSAPIKKGAEVPLVINNQALVGKELMIEAYLYKPEMRTPPGLVFKVLAAEQKKIDRVELFKIDDTPIEETTLLKYFQTVKVRVYTHNMIREQLKLTLYNKNIEGSNQQSNNEDNIIAEITKPTNDRGFLWHEFTLDAFLSNITNERLNNNSNRVYDYYVSVKSPEESKANTENQIAANKVEEVIISGRYLAEVGRDPLPTNGRSVSVVEEIPKTEDVLDAYFAKKVYTKKTAEEAGTFKYVFLSDGNKTKDDTQKQKIAEIIFKKKTITSLQDKKEYTTIEAIKAALENNIYNANDNITIKKYKLEADYVRINYAPLGEQLYLVVKTMLLDGKELTVSIKEKDGLFKDTKDAILPLLAIDEAQIVKSSEEINGTEQTTFNKVVENNTVTIPILLRPKNDEDFKLWQDKLYKGKPDGNYTYTFITGASFGKDEEKLNIAKIILKNAKEGLRGVPKIQEGKTAYIDDIVSVMPLNSYQAGNKIQFKLYKKQKEFLYLQVKAQGEKTYDKSFLKQEGAYFEIATGKCSRCEEEITVEQIKKVFKDAKNEALIIELTRALNKHRKLLGLDTCARKAHFFAQSRQEAGITLEPGVRGESFDYYKDNLAKVPLNAFKTPEGQYIASTYGRQIEHNAPELSEENQIILANFAYGPQYETGKNFKNSGNDGWNFRGRGLLQTTGRSNYIAIQEKIDRYIPNSGVNILKRYDNPNKAISVADGRMSAEEAALTGMVEWIHKEMHKIADLTGTIDDDTVVKKIINKINPNTGSKQERINHYRNTKTIFNVDGCLNIEKNNSEKPIMLSKHLSYLQAVESETAKNKGIDNTPNDSHLENLKLLGLNIYDKIYEKFDGNIILTSVYRNNKLNEEVRGSITSQHKYGEALDIKGINGVTNKEIFKYVKESLDYYQIIWEFGTEREPSWVHIGYKKSRNSKQNTRAIKVNGKTQYINFNLTI